MKRHMRRATHSRSRNLLDILITTFPLCFILPSKLASRFGGICVDSNPVYYRENHGMFRSRLISPCFLCVFILRVCWLLCIAFFCLCPTPLLRYCCHRCIVWVQTRPPATARRTPWLGLFSSVAGNQVAAINSIVDMPCKLFARREGH